MKICICFDYFALFKEMGSFVNKPLRPRNILFKKVRISEKEKKRIKLNNKKQKKKKTLKNGGCQRDFFSKKNKPKNAPAHCMAV